MNKIHFLLPLLIGTLCSLFFMWAAWFATHTMWHKDQTKWHRVDRFKTWLKPWEFEDFRPGYSEIKLLEVSFLRVAFSLVCVFGLSSAILLVLWSFNMPDLGVFVFASCMLLLPMIVLKANYVDVKLSVLKDGKIDKRAHVLEVRLYPIVWTLVIAGASVLSLAHKTPEDSALHMFAVSLVRTVGGKELITTVVALLVLTAVQVMGSWNTPKPYKGKETPIDWKVWVCILSSIGTVHAIVVIAMLTESIKNIS